jgi:hypothetical protein
MKKFVIAFFSFFLFISFILSPTYASEGLIKPNSPFYFLQIWGESIKLLLTNSSEQKINYLLELTDRRVDEIANNPSLTIINRYEKHFEQLDKLTTQIQDKVRVTERIKETSLHQQQVLSEIYSKVPQQAKEAVLNAQENSSKHVTRTIEAVEGSQEATEYTTQVIQIQQAEKAEQIEQTKQAPMENSPNSDPSQSAPRELKKTNPIKEEQQLNPLNPIQDANSDANTERIEPAQPIQMDQPVGQN